MNPQEEFVQYLEKNSQFYSISQSELFMKILSVLEKRAHSIEDLRMIFPEIDEDDLKLIIKSLTAVRLVDGTKISWNTFVHYATEEAKKFLAFYRNAKKSYDLG